MSARFLRSPYCSTRSFATSGSCAPAGRARGTYEGDRPAVFGAVSRGPGEAHLRVVKNSAAESLLLAVLEEAALGTRVMDDEGDGIREVHTNAIEGLWTGLRNWMRPFRGVSKKYLQGYVSAFEWGSNLKHVANEAPWKVVSAAGGRQQQLSYVPG